MKKIFLINGSPRGKNSASQYFIQEICELLDAQKVQAGNMNVIDLWRKNDMESVYEEVINSEVILFAFPLYVDSLPSHLIEFLIGLERFIDAHRAQSEGQSIPKAYGVVNCGFF